MKRLLQPFVLALTTLLAVAYAYVAWRLTSGPGQRWVLAVPFALIWIVPVVYWGGNRDRHGMLDVIVHQASYLCMGWVSFVLVLAAVRDIGLLATAWPIEFVAAHAALNDAGAPLVFAGALAALGIGALAALRGPHVRHVDIPVAGLHRDLDGFRIAQISDLHVGTTIRRRYVERVVELTNALAPHLVALTGDIVDGPVGRLAGHVAPLAALAQQGQAFFILGNHDCYAGARAWIEHFRALGLQVLLNSHALVAKGKARMLVGGVLDPAARASYLAQGPRPELAADSATPADFRLLLAHNPRVAPLAESAGFDLQLSGHTHAGQFFPWTLAVRLVHAPHVAGLTRQGRMWVYVSAGTGTWGPPVRLGTQPELTLIRLVCAPAAPAQA